MTDEQRRIFAAAADRVLPGVHLVGARAAGVDGYLARLWEHPKFRSAAPAFARGLALLEDFAQRLFDQPFAELSGERRDAVLRQLEAIPHPTARRFLGSLVRVSLAGYLCHPVHGGNRDRLAWRDLGVDYARQPGEGGVPGSSG